MLVVGVPRYDGGRGAVEVTSAAGRVVLTRDSLGLGSSQPGDRFGFALSAASNIVGADSCKDIVVGAPGADQAGRAYVLRGTPQGFVKGATLGLPAGASGDEFGYAVSADGHVVGAPGMDVGRAKDAGGLAWFEQLAEPPDLTAPPEIFTQARRGVLGTAESGDRFGEVLGRANPDGEYGLGLSLLVGMPHEDVGGLTDAGIVQQVTLLEDGRRFDRIFRQEAGGPLGVPEAGDRFGSSFVEDGWVLAVGVPGEDVGRIVDAGAVNLFSNFWDGGGDDPERVSFVPQRAVHQNSRRVPGAAERGDHFGASVTMVDYGPDTYGPKLAIGVPGEDLGGTVDAGMVVLYDPGLNSYAESEEDLHRPAYRSQSVTQGGNLAGGRAERGDRFGADLATATGTLLIAVPGEDIGSTVDAGLIARVALPTPQRRSALGFTGGPRTGLRYGTLW